MKYEYVHLENKYMLFAYSIAKAFYELEKWNNKTSPVAVIVQGGKVVSYAITADGAHARYGVCGRLVTPGQPYSDCLYCVEDQHAEQIAINRLKIDPHGSEIYIYGMYKVCPTCETTLVKNGITTCYLLEDSSVLFDRHNEKTVLGTKEQFIM